MWKKIASLILRNRLTILISLVVIILGLVGITLQKGVRFTTSNAQLLPSSDQTMIDFTDFQNTFGSEDNVIVIGYDDQKMANPVYLKKWQQLTKSITDLPGIDGIFSMTEAQKMTRDTLNGGFKTENLIPEEHLDSWIDMRTDINNFPFYESMLYNKNSDAMQAVIYMNPAIVDSKQRIQDVLEINKMVNQFTKETGISLYLSGMPVIRTMNSEQVKGETISFIFASLGVTCLIFFLFFRSFRATAVAVSVVVSAVVLCFAMLSLFGYEITLLTALVPPLLIVIGIPNCIYLINKYQGEYAIHKNKIKALQRMIMHVGNTAMLTNLTTAFGFFTFIFTQSSTLQEFGTIASLNIVGIFVFSLLIIPTAYSYFPEPKKRHLKHHEENWTSSLLKWMENVVLNHRPWVYRTTAVVLLAAIIGMFQMTRSGNLLDDMSKNAKFYRDIAFFDEEFGGVLPLEIVIDTKQPNGVTSLNTLTRMDRLNQYIDSLGRSSKTLSITELIKFSKQAYYSNDSAFYNLPTNQERAFILNEIKKTQGDANLVNNYVDSTGRKARMTTLLSNMDSKDMEVLIDNVKAALVDYFPEERYNTYVSGMAYVFMKGTEYLIKNLLVSLSLAILMIAIFMAFMFRSPQMILISLIPNLIPLLATAGLMGYIGVPIKPSTILVFSIAFGIAVDDTIHFLAKYRQDLHLYKGNIKKSVKLSIEEVGNSMLYTSIVLFSGFAIFLFSGFMGIVALGGLISFTLLMAMLSNLLVLPSLLLTYERLTTKDFTDPDVDYFDESDEDDDIEEIKLEA
ncbi:MMPL family transporter [Weeksellaceae bacterium KMM 9724]|uniref:efflux RND transporter permease subunit n=1 Tax=Profundicola chukchiensis TaxID=2961959 RepID=UPI00243F6B66|nr:MMPL family transporter [Profundicola chukchiensis]MDG4951021.1 MMPL family transporter [Profundicola chukchiensis]